MILILTNLRESSSSSVIDWLNYYNEKWIRVNSFDFETGELSIQYDQDSFLITSDNSGGIDLSQLKKAWYRRPPLYSVFNYQVKEDNTYFGIKVNTFTLSEKATITQLFVNHIDDDTWLTHPDSVLINKTYQLKVARACGLLTPDTLITSSKKSLLEFIKKRPSVIFKPLQNVLSIKIDGQSYALYTSELCEDDINALDEQFYPTQFQERIEKKYEVRTFYLDGEFYSMAIFSQNSQQSKVDFRNNNLDSLNRYVPYKLSKEIEDKVTRFMKQIKLNCGSIDLICDKMNRYHFLEVNPVGQFGFVSYTCNYNLEKKIAKYLMNEPRNQ